MLKSVGTIRTKLTVDERIDIETSNVIEIANAEIDCADCSVKRALEIISSLAGGKGIDCEFHITKEKYSSIESEIDRFARDNSYNEESVMSNADNNEDENEIEVITEKTDVYDDKVLVGYTGVSVKDKLITRKKDKAKVVIGELTSYLADTLRFKVYINEKELGSNKEGAGKVAEAIVNGLTESLDVLSHNNIVERIKEQELLDEKQFNLVVRLLMATMEQYYLNYVHYGEITTYSDEEVGMIEANINMIIIGLCTKKWKLIGDNLYYTLAAIAAASISEANFGTGLEKISKIGKLDSEKYKQAISIICDQLKHIDKNISTQEENVEVNIDTLVEIGKQLLILEEPTIKKKNVKKKKKK
jgi:hypothetical protein